VDLVVTTEAGQYVRDRGGVLYVRASGHRCCRGTLTLLDSTTERPSDAADYLYVGWDGCDVKFHGDPTQGPNELVIELRGRLRRRPVAYWDGCVYKP
jgi:hypothetical protein